jgi:hypothetical protein
VSTENDRLAAEVHDRVTNHIFGASLTLASVISGERVDDDIAQRLVDAIDTLDAAVRDLRILALARAIADRDHNIALERSRTTTPIASTGNSDVRAWLRRVKGASAFAYAGHDPEGIRASDRAQWAPERHGLLFSARSGMPLARRVDDVFYDLETDTPLYYQEAHQTPDPEPRPERSAIVAEVVE